MKSGFSFVLSMLALLILPSAALIAQEPPSEVNYRITLLVRNFQPDDQPGELGEFAADALAIALEKEGILHAVRPQYEARSSAALEDTGIEVTDPELAQATQGERGISLFLNASESQKFKITEPESEFVIEGRAIATANAAGLAAEIRRRTTNEPLQAGFEATEIGENSLMMAAESLAASISAHFASEVLEYRSEAVRRALVSQQVDREMAISMLLDMHTRWPDALGPVAVAYHLTTEDNAAVAPLAQEWRSRLVTLLPASGPSGERLLMRLGLDPKDFK